MPPSISCLDLKLIACHSGAALTPQLLKSRRVGSGVADDVLNIAVPETVLNEAGVCALVGESNAAGMAQHVGSATGAQANRLFRAIERSNVRGVPGSKPVPVFWIGHGHRYSHDQLR